MPWQNFYIYLLYTSELETCIVSIIYPFQTPAIWQNEVQSGHSRLQGRLAQDLKKHRMTGGDSETLTLAIPQLDSDMFIIPIGSMYDIFPYIRLNSMVNIGKLCHTWIHCGIYSSILLLKRSYAVTFQKSFWDHINCLQRGYIFSPTHSPASTWESSPSLTSPSQCFWAFLTGMITNRNLHRRLQHHTLDLLNWKMCGMICLFLGWGWGERKGEYNKHP